MATSQDYVVLVDCRQDLSIALNAVNRFAKRNLKAFSTKEKAFDWLASSDELELRLVATAKMLPSGWGGQVLRE